MRPVEKKKPGDIVRYTDSNNQVHATGTGCQMPCCRCD